MKKNIIIIFLMISNIIAFYLYQTKMIENQDLHNQITLLTPWNKIILDGVDANCQTNETYYWVSGNSMEPLIRNGSDVKVIENYYTCYKEVSRWDIVVYELNRNQNPMIKIVKAIPWDIIKFENRKMIINWEEMKNSTWEIYNFSDNEINLISAYLSDWKLQSESFFAFGDNVSNSIDSRKIWAIGINSFKAKVILK